MGHWFKTGCKEQVLRDIPQQHWVGGTQRKAIWHSVIWESDRAAPPASGNCWRAGGKTLEEGQNQLQDPKMEKDRALRGGKRMEKRK